MSNTPKTKVLRSNSLTIAVSDVKQMISSAKDEIIDILKKELDKMNTMLVSLFTRVINVEENLACVRTKQKELEKEINVLKDKLQKDISFSSSPTEICNEIEMRFARKQNLVIFGIPEKADGSIESRKKSDEEQFKILMRELEVDDVEFATLQRIGRNASNGARLMKVTGLNPERKREILSKAQQLRNSSTFRRVFIHPDLTPLQQKEHQFLRSELQRLRSKGEDVVIRHGKIVSRDTMSLFQKGF